VGADPITDCPIEQTLLSGYHEYCIKDTICQLRPNDYQIIIPTSELSFLNYISNASIEELISYAKVPPGGSGPIYTLSQYNLHPPKSENCYKRGFENEGTKYNTVQR